MKRKVDALAPLRTLHDRLSNKPSYEDISHAWYALHDLKIELVRDGGHTFREKALVRDLHAAMLDLTSDLQQGREPDGIGANVSVIALQSSIITRSLGAEGGLVLSEDDVLVE